jgi:hypothetical protein
MEKRQKLDVNYEKISFFEAKITNKNSGELAKTITADSIREVEIGINTWIKCGNYELLSLEKVEREQIKVAI